ncbi:MAG: DinB family protein [Bacteroidota bacterium]|nr:DinB family protein [Bacteroidota bacterium]
MNKETLLTDLDVSTKNLTNVLSQFTDETLHCNRSETEWTAAQIAEHLLLMEVIANKAIAGETITTNRPPDEKMGLIKWAMQDETKRVAPDSVIPSGQTWKPQEFIDRISHQRNKLRKAVEAVDITEACTLFKHPALGTLTRLEWVYFLIYHAERHLKQLAKLKEKETMN